MATDTPRVRRTINFKLGCLVSAAVAVAVLTIGLVTAWHEIGRFADGRREALLATATVFSAAVAKPVVANDASTVRQALRAIGRLPGAVEAEVYGAEGALIADLGGAARLSDDIDLTRVTDAALNLRLLTSETVKVVVPIIDSGMEVGKLVLISETGNLVSELRDLLLGLLGAGALALAISLAISLKLQRGITQPLVLLAAKMTIIRKSHDYRSSIEVRGSDETAVLASSFNAMISEILERDRALVRHQHHLESKVEERTQDLSHAKLAAEQANDAKSIFLATMSHEIRTPMNGMLAMAELLATSDLPSRQRRYAEVIARSGQSLVAIINDILDLSKVEAGKMEIESAPVAIADVVDTVVALFGERAHGKSLDLAAFVSSDVPDRCLGDEVRLTQILSNLVNNALKFTETGHVLVRVLRADTMMRIEVVDTGIGIQADKLGQIFASFTQAEQSTARRFGGTGLGLSICKKLVEAMGGKIGVTSRMDAGSTFWVTLPIEGEVAAAARPLAQNEHPVLIATERSAVLQSMLETFTEAGLNASQKALADGPAAFWITDAASLLERGHRPTGVAVIAVATPDRGSEDEVLARGLADRVLGWPVAQTELRPLVLELLAGLVDKRPQPKTEKFVPTETRFDGARVLVADDSAVNREVATEALRRFGIAAQTVEDGRAAVKAVLAGAFDLVLMDGSMPELDGFDATRRIRALEAANGRARTPIVAFTAYVLGAQASEWSAAGMDDVLHKPVTITKLEQCLLRWIIGENPSAVAETRTMASQAQDELLDEETLLQLEEMSSGGGGGFMERVFGLFSAQSGRLVDALEASVVQGYTGETARAAHALKSTSLNIGALAVATRAAEIELSANESGVHPDLVEIDTLRILLRDSEAALSKRLNVRNVSSAAA